MISPKFFVLASLASLTVASVVPAPVNNLAAQKGLPTKNLPLPRDITDPKPVTANVHTPNSEKKADVYVPSNKMVHVKRGSPAPAAPAAPALPVKLPVDLPKRGLPVSPPSPNLSKSSLPVKPPVDLPKRDSPMLPAVKPPVPLPPRDLDLAAATLDALGGKLSKGETRGSTFDEPSLVSKLLPGVPKTVAEEHDEIKKNGEKSKDFDVNGTGNDSQHQAFHAHSESKQNGDKTSDAVVAGGIVHENKSKHSARQLKQAKQKNDDEVINGGVVDVHRHSESTSKQ